MGISENGVVSPGLLHTYEWRLRNISGQAFGFIQMKTWMNQGTTSCIYPAGPWAAMGHWCDEVWGFIRQRCSWSWHIDVLFRCDAWSMATTGFNLHFCLVEDLLQTTKTNKAEINSIWLFCCEYHSQRERSVSLVFCFLLWLFVPNRTILEDSFQNMGLTLL